MMQSMYWIMAVVGLVAVAWGLPAAHRLRFPVDIVAALVALCGLVAFLLGALLIAVPGFFQG